ncbi:MAG: glycosyltransferase [Acidobacteria bacterium]|nr:glycosyltransferase [Acidobacteriota bacterium]
MIFWLCLAVIVFTYAGYPLLLAALVAIRRPRPLPEMTDWPRLSALIVAHNEQENIRNKIRNILENGYPPDKLEVIVCSDGSTDDTNKLVEQFGDQRVKLAASAENIGVNEAFALGAGLATGELLLMTDAGSLFEDGAISKVARLFADDRIGLATGRILYRNPLNSSVGKGYGAYWSIETRVRRLEAALGLAAVIVGAFEMVRRQAYLPVPSQYNNDMAQPVYARSLGFRVGFAPDALLVTVQRKNPEQEFARRLRMAIRGWSSIPYICKVAPPRKNPAGWAALICHKYLRWLSWLFMIGVLAANAFLLESVFFQVFFFLQAAFYLAAAAGWLLSVRNIRVKLLWIPFYFCLLQAGGMAGLIQTLRGKRMGVWKPVD